jgi:hypothetical protein
VVANPQRAVGEDSDDSGTGRQPRYARLGAPAPSSRHAESRVTAARLRAAWVRPLLDDGREAAIKRSAGQSRQ